jgi:predicted DNA-binding transcriptional regulator AlpA
MIRNGRQYIETVRELAHYCERSESFINSRIKMLDFPQPNFSGFDREEVDKWMHERDVYFQRQTECRRKIRRAIIARIELNKEKQGAQNASNV